MQLDASPRILLADDEPLFRRTTAEILRKAGYHCECVPDGQSAVRALAAERYDLLLVDLKMPGNCDLELLRIGREQHPETALIVITGVPTLPSAIESVRLGVGDYLLKPVPPKDLLAAVARLLPQRADARQEWPSPHSVRIIGESQPMREVLATVDRVAPTDANVMITGESGTGKEIIARTIHDRSSRASGPFRVIDCAAIPESLFESTLFGHARGAFTGAVRDHEGLLRQSHQGTAFLDEVGETQLTSQAKLLRAVQQESFTPVGTTFEIHIDTRFVAATNRDVHTEIEAGTFRRDLFYRLAVVHIHLPPLRDRGDDVQRLAQHFLLNFKQLNPRVETFAPAVLDSFQAYRWPGNIRELRNVIERALSLARGRQIELDDLPAPLRTCLGSTPAMPESSGSHLTRQDVLEHAERKYLVNLLSQNGGNVSRSAAQAGITRQGLQKLLAKYRLSAADYRS